MQHVRSMSAMPSLPFILVYCTYILALHSNPKLHFWALAFEQQPCTSARIRHHVHWTTNINLVPCCRLKKRKIQWRHANEPRKGRFHQTVLTAAVPNGEGVREVG